MRSVTPPFDKACFQASSALVLSPDWKYKSPSNSNRLAELKEASTEVIDSMAPDTSPCAEEI